MIQEIETIILIGDVIGGILLVVGAGMLIYFRKAQKKTCHSCRNLIPVDRGDRFAFDNYSDCCAEDGEGHDKNQEACEKYEEHEQPKEARR